MSVVHPRARGTTPSLRCKEGLGTGATMWARRLIWNIVPSARCRINVPVPQISAELASPEPLARHGGAPIRTALPCARDNPRYGVFREHAIGASMRAQDNRLTSVLWMIALVCFHARGTFSSLFSLVSGYWFEKSCASTRAALSSVLPNWFPRTILVKPLYIHAQPAG